jgi:hypothetical protein
MQGEQSRPVVAIVVLDSHTFLEQHKWNVEMRSRRPAVSFLPMKKELKPPRTERRFGYNRRYVKEERKKQASPFGRIHIL